MWGKGEEEGGAAGEVVWAMAQRQESMQHVLGSARGLVCLENRAHARELWVRRLGGGQERHIFQVGLETVSVIPC